MQFKKLLVASAIGLFGVVAAPTMAAPLSSALVPGLNTWSDDDAEVILKWDATLNQGAGGYRQFVFGVDTLGVQDILVGQVGLTSYPTGALGTNSNNYNEGTGLYAVQIASVVSVPASTCGDGPGTVLTTCASFGFTAATGANASDPLNGALSLLNDIYGTTIASIDNTSANSYAAFFEDSTPDYTRSGGSYNAAFASASDGTVRFILDLIAGNGDYFTTTAPQDPAQLGIWNALHPGANAGSFGAGSTISYQDFPGWNLGPQLTITGNISAANGGPFSIWSDSTYSFNAQRVPEPGTLAILGLGMTLLAVSRRRKNDTKS
jgi:hypothetical protein